MAGLDGLFGTLDLQNPTSLVISNEVRSLLSSMPNAQRGLEQFYKEHFPKITTPYTFEITNVVKGEKLIRCHIDTNDPWFAQFYGHFRKTVEIKCAEEWTGKQRAAFGCAQWILSLLESRPQQSFQPSLPPPQQMQSLSPSFELFSPAQSSTLAVPAELLTKIDDVLATNVAISQKLLELNVRLGLIERRMDELEHRQSQSAFKSLADAIGDR